MKQYFFFIVFLFSIPLGMQAQNFNNEYGKVGKEDIIYSNSPLDKEAEAVVIYDIGQSFFSESNNALEVFYERTTRIKIFKDAGIKYANVEIPLYTEGDIYESAFDIEACTYNFENGIFTRTNLDLTTCHDEKVNKYWINKKFAMPNVKAGSIIEYSYKISSQYVFKLRNWNFQWKIPVIYSKYTTKMIPFYQYTFLLQGANKFTSQKSYVETGNDQQFGSTKYQNMIYEFVMKDLPAFKDEEFITSEDDNIIKINFQLSKVTNQSGVVRNVISTWPELIKDLLKDEDFGEYEKKSEGMASKIFDLKSLILLPAQQKFDSILNYVKSNYIWNKSNFRMASKSVKAFIKDKSGNNADMNLFTIGLLNAAGIKAVPVILSTRENGKIKYDYPFSHFFNYVVILAEIDGKNILSDATIVLSSNNRIPEKCINDKGLIIQKDKIEWVSLQSLVPSKTQITFQMNLTDSINNVIVQTSATEYTGLDYRNDFGTNTHSIKQHLLDKGYDVIDSSIVVKNQTNTHYPYIVKYAIEVHPEKLNDKIYVSPFLHEVMAENPLKQSARTYPIDMIYPKKSTFYSEISIPEGYKVDFLPAIDNIKNEMFELEYSAQVKDQKINVILNYYFKVPVYEAVEYSKIKYYFNEIVNKGSEKIVFVKK